MTRRLCQIILLGLLLSTLTSCKYLSFYRSIKGQQLQFGSGGGFTGLVTEYTLSDKGELFVKTGLSATPTLLRTLSKSELKTIFKQLKKLGSDSKSVNNPGNMTYFLKLSGGKQPLDIKWSDPGSVPTELKTLYEQLVKLTLKR